MTDDRPDHDDFGDGDLDPAEFAAVSAWLSDPAQWAEPSADVEDRVVAFITAAAPSRVTMPGPTAGADRSAPPANAGRPTNAGPRATATDPNPATPAAAVTATVTDLASRRRRGGRALAGLAAAAAVVVAVLGAVAVLTRDGGGADLTVALAGSEFAPGASAVAAVDSLPNGARIIMDIDGLDPAPPGTFYTAWVVKEEPRTRIPIGSFHMRGGDGAIELWSGVLLDGYPLVTVTLQDEADPAGPGQPMLAGRVGG